jgi:hypothetical protein
MTDDTRRVLEMLSQGKIGVQEAEDLLKALRGGEASPDAQAAKKDPKWLRITVDKQGPDGRTREVNMRVPVSLMRAGVRLSALMPRIIGTRLGTRLATHGLGPDAIDFTKIDPKDLEAMINDMGEMVIDVDNGRAQVRINCE